MMDLETLFTASKWEILRHLSEAPLSPIQLAERSSTSLANISQQLRLLEMAGLVTSKRISNRDKGQPRIIYSLAADQGYFIAAANDFTEKRLFKLNDYNKAVLKIWFYEDPNTRYLLEKAFWRIESFLPKMRKLGVKSIAPGRIAFCVVSDQLSTGDLPDFTFNDLDGEAVRFTFECDARCEKAQLIYASEATAR